MAISFLLDFIEYQNYKDDSHSLHAPDINELVISSSISAHGHQTTYSTNCNRTQIRIIVENLSEHYRHNLVESDRPYKFKLRK